jgi:hypothetical protein
VPTDHWTSRPQTGRHHHPVWSTIFPKYDEPTRQAGIGRSLELAGIQKSA